MTIRGFFVLVLVCLLFLTACLAQEKDLDLLYQEGLKQYQEKRLGLALETFQKVIARDKEQIRAYVMLGKTHYYANRMALAEANFKLAYDKNKNFSDALFWYAQVLYRKKENAENSKEKIIQHRNLALALVSQLLEQDTYHIRGRILKSNLLLGFGRIPEAIAELKAAISEKESIALAHIRLGNIYKGGGRLDRANYEYQNARFLDPKIKINDHYNSR